MAHPKKLIKKCLESLLQDYPETLYRYEIEKSINGTRMFPDVIIYDSNDKIVCAVEIGYTRPDKIRKYRELGIPDIRWYSKGMDLILHEQDSEYLQKIEANKAVSKTLKDTNAEVKKMIIDFFRRDFHLLYIPSYCEECESEGIDPEDNECGEFIYMTYKGYQIVHECNLDSTHDWNEFFKWTEVDGLYYGEKEQLLKDAFKQKLYIKTGKEIDVKWPQHLILPY